MKDKRTYKYEKEHGEDMSHENETKIDAVTALTDQYRAELHQYKEREGLHIKTENQGERNHESKRRKRNNWKPNTYKQDARAKLQPASVGMQNRLEAQEG